jgi:hypothetical protein
MLLAVGGVVFAVAPFARPGSSGTVLTETTIPSGAYPTAYSTGSGPLSRDCEAPIVSAWQKEQIKGGWFGYAPLVQNGKILPTSPPALPVCGPTARRHLAYAAILWLAAVGAFLLARRPRASGVQIAPA